MYFSHQPVVCGQEYVPHPVVYGMVYVFLPAAEDLCIGVLIPALSLLEIIHTGAMVFR